VKHNWIEKPESPAADLAWAGHLPVGDYPDSTESAPPGYANRDVFGLFGCR